MKILLISDTHGAVQTTQDVIYEEKADVVLHMGDVGFDSHYLGQIYYVKGNHDLLLKEPWERLLTFANKTIFMVHGNRYEKEIVERLKGKYKERWFDMGFCIEEYTELLRDIGRKKKADVVCFGHLHQPFIRSFSDLMIINPGSLALSYDGKNVSYAILNVDGNQLHAQLKYRACDEK